LAARTFCCHLTNLARNNKYLFYLSYSDTHVRWRELIRLLIKRSTVWTPTDDVLLNAPKNMDRTSPKMVLIVPIKSSKEPIIAKQGIPTFYYCQTRHSHNLLLPNKAFPQSNQISDFVKQLKHVVCLSFEATHNLNLHYQQRDHTHTHTKSWASVPHKGAQRMSESTRETCGLPLCRSRRAQRTTESTRFKSCWTSRIFQEF